MKIALAQINPTVGDITGNCGKILDFIDQARARGAKVVVFPELSIIGYPPKDLLLKPRFIDDNLRGLQQIASRVSGIDAVVGYAERNSAPIGRPLHNAVAVLREGKIISRHFKTLLPTYDVFDESRYFEPGLDERQNIVNIAGRPMGLSICEDLWNDEKMVPRRLYHQNPIADLNTAGAQVMINASASPFVVGKHKFRVELFSSQVRQFGKPLVYVNQVGGNDELVFDGNSVVFDAKGNVIAQAKDFEEDLLVVDLERPEKFAGKTASDIESMYKALVLGLRDYVSKCGFKSVVLGKEKVGGVGMPSRFSSEGSVADAKTLAENLGIEFHIIPIAGVHDAYEETLTPIFAGRERDVTEENLQARVRGGILMALSNKFNHLLLTTGNKSELAVGYCTLYGDMCGGLAVISDVPKTSVYELATFVNKRAGK